MKKSIIIIVSVLFVFTASAQWSAGGRAGINICKTTGKWSEFDDSKHKFIVGPTIMGMGNYQFTDMFSASGEFGYTVMGNKTVSTIEERAMNMTQYELWEKFHTLQTSIAFKAVFMGSFFQLFALLGVYYNFKLGGVQQEGDGDKQKVGWDSNGNRSLADGDKILLDPDRNRRGDLGIQLGGGIGKELGPGRLELDLRFGYGFLDLAKWPEGTTKPDGYKSYHNMNISITVGYWYLFNKK